MSHIQIASCKLRAPAQPNISEPRTRGQLSSPIAQWLLVESDIPTTRHLHAQGSYVHKAITSTRQLQTQGSYKHERVTAAWQLHEQGSYMGGNCLGEIQSYSL